MLGCLHLASSACFSPLSSLGYYRINISKYCQAVYWQTETLFLFLSADCFRKASFGGHHDNIATMTILPPGCHHQPFIIFWQPLGPSPKMSQTRWPQVFPCRTWKHPVKNGLWPTEGSASEIVSSQPPCPKWVWRAGSLTPSTWGKNPGKKTVAGTSQTALVTAVCCDRGMWPCRTSQWMKPLETGYRKVKTA